MLFQNDAFLLLWSQFLKILCIFASILFKKLTLSEVLSKILNKVLWLLFRVAASNVVKTNRMMITKFTINAIYKGTVKLLKLKKRWTDREIYFRHFRSFDSLFLIISMSARFFFQTARKNNLFGCNISFNHFVLVLFAYCYYKFL